MDTNETVRQRALKLIDLGVPQQKIADKMGVTETWFSRWINQKGDKPPELKVTAMDRFADYVQELLRELQDTETKRALDAAAAGPPFHRQTKDGAVEINREERKRIGRSPTGRERRRMAARVEKASIKRAGHGRR